MTPTPSKGGIFQFLTKLVAQTALQHELLGHDLCFSTVPNMLQTVCGSPFLPQKVHFLSITAISLPPPHVPHLSPNISAETNNLRSSP